MNDAITDEEKELLAQLEAAEAERDQKRERVAEKTRTNALRDRIEKAKREAAEAEKLEELIEEHGPLGKLFRVLTTDGGHMIAVKAAPRQIWRRFESGMDKSSAREELVRACVIYPSKAEFEDLVNRWPGLILQAVNEITILVTGKQQELTGK